MKGTENYYDRKDRKTYCGWKLGGGGLIPLLGRGACEAGGVGYVKRQH